MVATKDIRRGEQVVSVFSLLALSLVAYTHSNCPVIDVIGDFSDKKNAAIRAYVCGHSLIRTVTLQTQIF